jgi:uncharacterized membrane protein YgcG
MNRFRQGAESAQPVVVLQGQAPQDVSAPGRPDRFGEHIIAAGTGILSRRSLFWAAWILLIASMLLPAPAGSFAGGATNVSGIYVLGKVIVWSRAAPGSTGALDFWRLVILTLGGFANMAFLFTPILRKHASVSTSCKCFLIGGAVMGGCLAFSFADFARLQAYWLWLASVVALALAFIAFPGSGAIAKSPSKRASAGDGSADTGDVPQLIWVWLGFAVFWLIVTGINHSHPAPATATTTAATTNVPTAAALTGYFNDPARIVPPGVAAQLDAALAKFEQQTSNQIAVAIYPRAPHEAIESFTIETADRSRLGRKGLDNGAILFVFMAERSARLEVGYGLEGVLTDVDAHRILDTQLVPAFAKGDYAEGLDATLGAIFTTVQDAYKGDRMPGKPEVFWRQLKVEVPKLIAQAWPALGALELDARFAIAFFGGLLGLGIWGGIWQLGRLLRNLARGVGNLAARRPFNTGMESVGLDSVIDTFKVVGFVLACIAGAAGLVIVAAGGAFGGAGTLVHW